MIPGLINPKRIISTNNCRLANRQLSSRDGTSISVSCNAHHIPINISSTIININININLNINTIHSHITFQSITHNIFPQQYSPKSQLLSNSFSILTTSQITIITIHLQIYHTIPKYPAPPDRILHICVKIFYIKIIVFEGHPITCFV